MKNFIKGALFALFVLPVLDCILQILQQSTNHICTWIASKTYEIKKSLGEDEECGGGCAIGFHMPDPAEEYYDEEDE